MSQKAIRSSIKNFSQHFSPLLLKVMIALSMPAVACFGYYSIDQLDPALAYLAIPVSLAAPLLLIAVVALISLLTRNKPSRLLLWLAVLFIAAAVSLLIFVWN